MLKSLTRPHHHPTTVGDIEATILTPRFGEAWADTLADVRPILLGCEQVDEPCLIERVSAFFFHLRQAILEVPDVRASGLLLTFAPVEACGMCIAKCHVRILGGQEILDRLAPDIIWPFELLNYLTSPSPNTIPAFPCLGQSANRARVYDLVSDVVCRRIVLLVFFVLNV